MSCQSRVALLGGTFDPIHLGHIWLAREFARILSLDRIVLMPSSIPPHKLRAGIAAPEHRIAMCNLAVENDNLFEVSDFEIKCGGASYTVNTLTWLRGIYPDSTLYLLIGADMFLNLFSWYQFDEISRIAVLCTAPRGDITTEQLRACSDRLENAGAQCVIADIPAFDVSSTEIRTAITEGYPLNKLLAAPVSAYITEHQLYFKQECDSITDLNDQYVQIIRGRLSDKRFNHSLSVAMQSHHLAARYGADCEKAYTAGLLHDILKEQSPKEQLQMMRDFDIILTDVERRLHKCWHAIAGAAFIQRILHVEDHDMINAVRYHTTARAGMSVLEKTLYLADFTSADRDFSDVDVIRELAEKDCRQAMLYALSYTIRELLDKGHSIHPDTLHAYNEALVLKN